MRAIVRWAFYLFIFSLAFEVVDIGIAVEPPTIAGGLLVLAALLQPRLFFSRVPAAIWLFIAYLCWCVALVVVQAGPHTAEAFKYIFVFAQLMILCWIAYGLMRHEEVAKTALIVLAVACLILAILQLTGAASQPAVAARRAQRLTAFGFHPNNIARIYAIGLLVLVGFTYVVEKSIIRARFLAWPAMALLAVAIIQTGSRGGLLALGIGMLIYAATGKTISIRLRNALVVALALGLFGWLAYNSEVTKSRFESAIEQGELARRERIYPLAAEMILEKPLFGWGPAASSYELGARLQHPVERTKNPHNLILEVLVATGLVGGLFFFAGTALVVLAALRSRRSAHAVVPLALVGMVLAANMSGLWHFNKLHWIVMAYALASSSYAAAGARKRAAAIPRLQLRPLTLKPARRLRPELVRPH